MRFAQVQTAFVALLSLVSASPLVTREERIPHKDVVPLDEALVGGAYGKAYKKFQPYLTVSTGCVPFPAVDKDGRLRYAIVTRLIYDLCTEIFCSNGLKKGGTHNGQCSESKGQIYTRGLKHDGKYALMYTW